jgi:pyrroline-5-carboxylate reductase
MKNELAGKRIAFLGAGKMGSIILQALLKNGLLSAKSTCATVAHEERAKALAAKLKVKVGTNNVEAVKGADIIVIGVKQARQREGRRTDLPHV